MTLSLHPIHRPFFRALLRAASAIAACALAGCGAGVKPTGETASAPVAVTASGFAGVVMGGQQPVAGVTVQLYQAGTSGYGSAATALGSSVHTTASGNFNLPSYTCTPGSQVYLVGTGGQPIAAVGNTPAVTNNNLAMMVGLGACSESYQFINVNELTTVATVWALAPFMTGIANIGTSSTNTTGLANAFAAINEIVNPATGKISGSTNAVLPTNEIDTLADILEQCINSGGGTENDGSGCGKLFLYAPNAAGTVYPTDTITAAMNIAQSPGRNVAALNHLRSANPVFQPALDTNSAPNAWTIAITYSGGGLNAPTSIAADANGAVWITNSGGSGSVTKLSNTGAAVSGSPFTAGGLNAPTAIAIDSSGNAWVTNSNNSVTELNPAGTSGTVYTGNGLSTPASIAIDGSGNIWVANEGSSTVSAFTNTGSALNPNSPFSGAGTSTPASIAVTPK